jgi:hypothetical protein
MGLRKETRLGLALPVRVSGENAGGESFEQDCTTVDLTVNGLRVVGLTQTLRRGAVISVSYGAKSAPAHVMWTGKTGADSQGHAGLQVVGGWNNLWGRAIPRIPGDGFPNSAHRRTSMPDSKPTTKPAAKPDLKPDAKPVLKPVPKPKPSDRSVPALLAEMVKSEPVDQRVTQRYPCGGGASIWQPGAKHFLRGTVVDLSLGGCYVEMMTALKVHDLVVLTLDINGTEVRMAAEVRTSHPGMGMGLKFKDLAETDRSRLRDLVFKLGDSGTGQFDVMADVRSRIEILEEEDILQRECEKRRDGYRTNP